MSEQKIEIKRVSATELEALSRIEALSFSSPWSQKSLELLLGERAFGLCAVVDGEAVAYVGVLCVLDEGQITNVATHPDYRRRGLARTLMTSLEGYARERGIAFLSLEVRRSNEAALALYRGLGWREAGVRKGFYSHPTEDAIVMTKNL